ncbi:MAG TPA: hypothetical protein VK530_12960 [Candidatus Acidoferrum sp.]|nr:hypothetical protein [Candidatus Acidoferrum sp.]
MSDLSLENGQVACNLIRDRLMVLFPQMTFKVSPQNGTCALRITLPGTIRILGQRTANMRYDRGNHYASFDVSGDDYISADAGAGTDVLLRSAMADIEAQLRMRNQ